MKAQVIVLGGGCGGLWLLYELAKRHYCSVLIDGPNIGGFASTRNQSWLHTGAFYALADQTFVAQQCVLGRKALLEFCNQWAPGAIADQSQKDESRCFILFEEHGQVVRKKKKLQTLGIQADILDEQALKEAEPILSSGVGRSTPLRWGLRTLDAPFDSFRVMQGLVNAAFSHGDSAFYGHIPGDLSTLSVSKSDGGDWRVSCEAFTVEAPIVVCAAGALNASILHKNTGSAAGLTIQKCFVAVFHEQLCKNILVVRSADSGYPNLVPFAGGTTVNLGALDRRVTDPADGKPWAEPYADLSRQLSHFFPGVVRLPACLVHFYVCQKLNNTNHERNPYPLDRYAHRHFFWLEEPDNMFYFYPGKFTTAPIAGSEFAKKLIGMLGSPRKPVDPLVHTPPSLVQRVYLSQASHYTSISNKMLTFEKLDG